MSSAAGTERGSGREVGTAWLAALCACPDFEARRRIAEYAEHIAEFAIYLFLSVLEVELFEAKGE